MKQGGGGIGCTVCNRMGDRLCVSVFNRMRRDRLFVTGKRGAGCCNKMGGEGVFNRIEGVLYVT
jgi:hypothetical protein